MPEPDRATQTTNRTRLLMSLVRGIAAVSGVFVIVVTILLFANYVQLKRSDPVGDRIISQLRTDLREKPLDQTLREQIRLLDLLSRKALFTSLSLNRHGTFMLIGGIALTLLSLHVLAMFGRRLPHPPSCAGPDEAAETRPRARWAIAGLAAALAASGVMLIMLTRTQLDRMFSDTAVLPSPTGTVAATVAAAPYPGQAEIQSNWPCFRGPDNCGIAYCTTAPVSWDGASGSGILWKAALPCKGNNSPVVWNNHVYLTGGDHVSLEVLCFDAVSGSPVWRTRMKTPSRKLEKLSDDAGYAASTVATDGRYVCAIFATGDIACLSPTGDVLWVRNLGVPEMNYGYASSLIIWHDVLLVQRDVSEKSMLIGLDVATGTTRWETPRTVNSAWTTPVIAVHGGHACAVLAANPLVAAYAVETGKELWQVECMGGEVAPSPAIANDIVFAAQDGCGLKAVRIGETNLLWESSDDLPDVATPLALSNLVLTASSSSAVITCFDGPTSNVLWRQEFPKGFYASPVYAAGNVYATDMAGVAHVFKAERTYEPVASNALGEAVVCTPAIVQGRMFIRGDKHLYCIGEK